MQEIGSSNPPVVSGICDPSKAWAQHHRSKKHIACNYGYKLECVDDKFSKPFKTYLGEDAVDNFISNLIEESKYGSDVMKKYFKKELVMTKEDNEEFKNSTKCWICDNDYVDNDVKNKRSLSYHWKI